MKETEGNEKNTETTQTDVKPTLTQNEESREKLQEEYLFIFSLQHEPTVKTVQSLCEYILHDEDKYAQSMAASSLIRIGLNHPELNQEIEKQFIQEPNIHHILKDELRVQRITQVLADVGGEKSLKLFGQEILLTTNPVKNYWYADAISRIRLRLRKQKQQENRGIREKIGKAILQFIPSKIQLIYFLLLLFLVLETVSLMKFFPTISKPLMNLFFLTASLIVLLSGVEVTNSLMAWLQKIIDFIMPLLGDFLLRIRNHHPKLYQQLRSIPKIGPIFGSFVETKEFSRKIEKSSLRLFIIPMFLYLLFLLTKVDDAVTSIITHYELGLDLTFNIPFSVPLLSLYFLLIKQTWFILFTFSGFMIEIARSRKRGVLPSLYGKLEETQPSWLILSAGLIAGVSLAVVTSSPNKEVLDSLQVLAYFLVGMVLTFLAFITFLVQVQTRLRMTRIPSSITYFKKGNLNEKVYITSSQQFGEIHVFVFGRKACSGEQLFWKTYLTQVDELLGVINVKRHKQFFQSITQEEGFILCSEFKEFVFYNSGPGVYIDFLDQHGEMHAGGDYGNWWWNRVDGEDFDTMIVRAHCITLSE